MMKKFASLFLALALCMGLATTAFAAESKTFHSDFGYDDTVTIDAVGKYINDISTYYEIPVGAVITAHVGANATLCVAEGAYIDDINQTIVHWSYDPAAKAMVRTDDENFYGHNNCATLPAGDYSFTVTQEMADSFAIFKTREISEDYHPSVSLMAGRHNDFGTAVSVSILFEGSAAAETPAAPTQPTAPAQPTAPTQPSAPAQPTSPAQPAAPAAAGSYTVKKGDTYGTIALNNYGTYGVWKALYKANKGAKLTAGVTLTLPEKLGKVALIAAPAAADGETLYTVKAGDTLGAIAKATYGDVMKYKAIFERNTDRLKNANTIYEGQVIVLPAK